MTTQFDLTDYHQELSQLTPDLIGGLLFAAVAKDAFCYPEDLHQVFTNHQMPTDGLPEEVSLRAAMSKATSAVVTMLNGSAQPGCSFHKESKLEPSSPDHLRLGIYQTRSNSTVTIEAQHIFEIDRRDGSITRCDHEMWKSYLSYYRSPLTASELRNLLTKMIRTLDPTRILQGTFVPAYKLTEAEKLAGALNDVTGMSVVVLPLPAVDSVKQHAWQAFLKETRENLAEFRREIEEDFGNGSTRPSTLRRRLDRYQELKNRADAYASLLNFTSDDIETEVKTLTAQVNKMLGVA